MEYEEIMKRVNNNYEIASAMCRCAKFLNLSLSRYVRMSIWASIEKRPWLNDVECSILSQASVFSEHEIKEVFRMR